MYGGGVKLIVIENICEQKYTLHFQSGLLASQIFFQQEFVTCHRNIGILRRNFPKCTVYVLGSATFRLTLCNSHESLSNDVAKNKTICRDIYNSLNIFCSIRLNFPFLKIQRSRKHYILMCLAKK